MAPHNARLGVEFLPTTDFSDTKTHPRERAGFEPEIDTRIERQKATSSFELRFA
jgi:hypothetical protein